MWRKKHARYGKVFGADKKFVGTNTEVKIPAYSNLRIPLITKQTIQLGKVQSPNISSAKLMDLCSRRAISPTAQSRTWNWWRVEQLVTSVDIATLQKNGCYTSINQIARDINDEVGGSLHLI